MSNFTRIEFDKWIDEAGNWTSNPAKHIKVILICSPALCVWCSNGAVHGHSKCDVCNGVPGALEPCRAINKQDDIEAYYKQLEIQHWTKQG